MREHEIAYWQEQIATAMEVTALLPKSDGIELGQSVPGSRVLITQQLLDASRMLRYIPRLPVQNANWLHFAYGAEFDQLAHQSLTTYLFELESSDLQLHDRSRAILYQLAGTALLHERLARQPGPSTIAITPGSLALMCGSLNPTPESWRKSRWAPRWRSLLERANVLDRHSIEELVQLRALIRQYQEINTTCQSNPSSRH
ncbi:hypothetical protein ACET8O_20180 [Aeromonas veronii]